VYKNSSTIWEICWNGLGPDSERKHSETRAWQVPNPEHDEKIVLLLVMVKNPIFTCVEISWAQGQHWLLNQQDLALSGCFIMPWAHEIATQGMVKHPDSQRSCWFNNHDNLNSWNINPACTFVTFSPISEYFWNSGNYFYKIPNRLIHLLVDFNSWVSKGNLLFFPEISPRPHQFNSLDSVHS
jgi:hypothetical protein